MGLNYFIHYNFRFDLIIKKYDEHKINKINYFMRIDLELGLKNYKIYDYVVFRKNIDKSTIKDLIEEINNLLFLVNQVFNYDNISRQTDAGRGMYSN